MKARRIGWVAIPLVVLGLLVAGAQGLIAWRATALVNRALSHAAAGMPDSEWIADTATVSLLAGRLNAESVRVAARDRSQPPLFQAGGIGIDAAWPASLRNRRWVIRRLELSDGRLRIERYPDKTWNLAVVLPPPQPDPGVGVPDAPITDVEPPVADVTPPAVTPPPKPMPPLQVDRIRLTLAIEWRDATRTGSPVELDYRLTLDAGDVRTVGDAAQPWADVRLSGHLADAPHRGQLALTGRLAPVQDPSRLSFDLSGSLSGVDSELLRALSGWDVELEGATFDVELVCRDGIIDPARSRLTLRARSLRLGDSFHASLAGMRVSRLTVPVGLSGALDQPRIAWDQALAEAVRQAGNAAVMQGLERLFR